MRVSITTQIKPFRLPRTDPAPIDVFLAGHVSSTTGGVPSQLTKMTIYVNRHGLLDTKAVPACPVDEIRPATTDKALERCGRSLIGSGYQLVLAAQGPGPNQTGPILGLGAGTFSPNRRPGRSRPPAPAHPERDDGPGVRRSVLQAARQAGFLRCRGSAGDGVLHGDGGIDVEPLSLSLKNHFIMLDAQLRTALAERLFDHRLELEAAARERIGSLSPSDSLGADEFNQAVSAAISYGIEAVATGGDRPPPLPDILLTRARFAAREGVELQTLVRRYLAGFTAFGDFLLEQVEHRALASGTALRQLFDELASVIDRAVATVGSEYARAVDGGLRSPSERRADLVTRLLAGELLEPAELAYDFAVVHLGLIALGDSARAAVDRLAAQYEARCLLVEPDSATVWAWLGSRRGLDPDAILAGLGQDMPRDVALAFGEPAPSLAGWRLTHRQAHATVPFARGSPAGWTRYRAVALLASAQRDDLLVDSLRRLYIAPLEERDGTGAALCETLRTYFAVSSNVSSTAAKLRINRRTVTKRIRSAEQCLGQSLSACATDLQIALRIAELPSSEDAGS